MTVDTAMIERVSPYRLNKDFVQGDFDFYLGAAKEQFARDNPGLGPYQSDLAVAYYVAHLIFIDKRGASDKLSEKIGDTYVTYAQSKMPNTYLSQYKEIVAGNAIAPSRGVERSDAPTSRDFQLSEQRVPDIDSKDQSALPNIAYR